MVKDCTVSAFFYYYYYFFHPKSNSDLCCKES